MTTSHGPHRRGRPPTIDRSDVVDAAVALAGEGGLDAVTIRGVAARLRVAPMTLYGHVSGVDELVDLVVAAGITAEVDRNPERFRSGREALVGFAHGLRSMFLDRPAVLEVYRRRPILDPTGVAVADNVLTVLTEEGLDDEAAVGIYAAVYAYVVGFVSLQMRPVALDPAALAGRPTLARLREPLADLFGRSAFEQGLAALVDSVFAPEDAMDQVAPDTAPPSHRTDRQRQSPPRSGGSTRKRGPAS